MLDTEVQQQARVYSSDRMHGPLAILQVNRAGTTRGLEIRTGKHNLDNLLQAVK